MSPESFDGNRERKDEKRNSVVRRDASLANLISG
jgi:hypothetical protein